MERILCVGVVLCGTALLLTDVKVGEGNGNILVLGKVQQSLYRLGYALRGPGG